MLLLYRSLDPSKFAQADQENLVTIDQLELAAIPVKSKVAVDPVINATAAYVTDEDTGAVLFSKNAETLYAPASTTKLMTALVARQEYKSGSVVTVNFSGAVGGTVLGLRQKEQYTLDSLLEAALISSANDAAEALAAHHPNGVSAFVKGMNAKAEELHLDNTQFNNASGFDSRDHYSTARDLAILAREVLQDPVLRRMVNTQSTEIRDITGSRRLTLRNTNQLLGKDPRVQGVKTGTTEEAGEVLITSVKDGQRNLLLVVLGSSSRYTDTQTLMDWVATNYTWYAPEELLQHSTALK
ncbi:MAG: hypothetical protein QG639_799 [Patescibacteria group bacterium]|nr:hypothetical protein [Patescibacteria group bacterium]